MNRRKFLAMGVVSSCAPLGLTACASLSVNQAIVVELQNQLTSPTMYWTNVMLRAIRAQNSSPLSASRAAAMAHLSGLLAVSGNDLGALSDGYTSLPPSHLNQHAAYGIAFSHALEEALSVSLAPARKRYLAQLADRSHLDDSALWAKSQARRVIQWRTQDGAQIALYRIYPSKYTQTPQLSSLSWTPTGPFYGAKNGPAFKNFSRGNRPAWGQQKTWLINSINSFEARPFPAADSPEFQRQFEKIREIGRDTSQTRTTEQKQIALFWEDGLMGITSVGHFQLIAMQLLSQRQFSLIAEARAFALLSLTMADAAVVAWYNKYRFNIIRPETAIRFANSRFSNPKSLPQTSNWQSYIPTPPFPSYISGHSTFGAAACGVLAYVLGSDQIKLHSPAPDTVNWPHQLHNVHRYYTSLRQIAEENGVSREYGGVHWEADNLEGLRLGYAIADMSIKQTIDH